jgi:hypothetical protein
VDDSGAGFFHVFERVLTAALAACFLACTGSTAFAETEAIMIEAGGVALWTKADSVTRFDQVRITPLPQGRD